MLHSIDTVIGAPFAAAARLLRWLIDDPERHQAWGALLTMFAMGTGWLAGTAYMDSENKLGYAVIGLAVSWVWKDLVVSEYRLIVRTPPDMLVLPHNGIVTGRLLYIANIVLQLPNLVTGDGKFPPWTLGFDVALLVGSYLMYLPAGASGRRSWVRRAGERFSTLLRPAPSPSLALVPIRTRGSRR